MTTDKLQEILSLMVDVDDELRLQTSLAQIRDNLSNLTNSPSAPQFQTALAAALSTFKKGADRLAAEIRPAQGSAIAELGGAEFFDPVIEERVRTAVERNAMTPSVARDYITDLATRRAAFLKTVETTLAGLAALKTVDTSSEPLPPGEAAFTIPRNLFANSLGSFAKELIFLNQMLEHMSEASTGELQSVELEGLSSSTPTVAVAAGLGLLKLLGTVINSFLDAWEKVQKARGLREQLKEVGVSKLAAEELTDQITTMVEQVVEESTTLCLVGYNKDTGRRNELENALRVDLGRLFGQIELGLTVEIKTHETVDASESDMVNKKAINELSHKMQFPAISKEAILLSAGEVLEGDIARIKVTTTKKTTQTTSNKRSAKLSSD